jgi:hypothetical protein
LARLESMLLRTVDKFESSSALMTRIELRAVHAVVGMASTGKVFHGLNRPGNRARVIFSRIRMIARYDCLRNC